MLLIACGLSRLAPPFVPNYAGHRHGMVALPSASVLDTGRALRDVLLPVVARGAILRRPEVSHLAERLRVDDRALRQVRRLRQRYGDGPVLLRLPGRTIALVTAPGDVRRLLDETPEPFSTATADKVGALRHFQPHAVLVTDPPLRASRRELNEQALESHQPVHRHGHRMLEVIRDELDSLHATLAWDDFRAVWSRIVRRIVLGDGARNDTALTARLDRLPADANWAGFRPRHDAVRRELAQELDTYVDKREPGSLVEMLPPASPDFDPAGQVPHWLFAFDAAGIALWRVFAVLATRGDVLDRIASEAEHPELSPLLSYAGAAVQESLRLWPTTLVVLRESRSDTEWRGRTVPAGTEFAIVSSVFHRDTDALEFANRFEPEVWLDGRTDGEWPVIPFSDGPATCPARNVVLLTTSAAVSHVTDHYALDVDPATRNALAGPMPATLDHTRIRIGFWRTQ
ncbi:cytochrome P450 [Kribbella pittospori]|uniref:Cytochrome P450 n=1 Tax=Kribbella pittospori TaxID=722689 RepID=A0A4R0KU23_9ACTN|nr:cytochrome P450 [Kribbella pittospori]TCC64069.1 cytochrome P450 [Kribbella pittospori]